METLKCLEFMFWIVGVGIIATVVISGLVLTYWSDSDEGTYVF